MEAEKPQFFIWQPGETGESMVYVYSVGYVWLFVTPWTVAHKAPLSMIFSRQEYLVYYSPWGCKESDATERFHFHFLSFPTPGESSRPRDGSQGSCISCIWQADSLPLSHQGSPRRANDTVSVQIQRPDNQESWWCEFQTMSKPQGRRWLMCQLKNRQRERPLSHSGSLHTKGSDEADLHWEG